MSNVLQNALLEHSAILLTRIKLLSVLKTQCLFFLNGHLRQVLLYTLFVKVNQSSGTNLIHNWENTTCEPLNFIIDIPILIVFICMRKSIEIQKGQWFTDISVKSVKFKFKMRVHLLGFSLFKTNETF